MERVVANSSNVARYAYDTQARGLYVEFHGGSSGYHSEVPPDVYEAFHAAVSKGTFIGRRLRDNPRFPWARLTSSVGGPRAPRLPRDETRYRYRCPVYGAVRTLADDAPAMPKHPRKGDRSRSGIPCIGSGGFTINLGLAPPKRSRAR